jgi:hypothetical protein
MEFKKIVKVWPEFNWFNVQSRGSSVAIAAGVRFPARERDFSLLHSVQTGSRAH